jgi:Putative bacterial sensory transduction regulator
MSAKTEVDRSTLQGWLEQMGADCYVCHQCEGLHIAELQQLDGVIDSRLFKEPYGLLLTTELEVRPLAIFVMVADLARLNMDYPTLKIFLDVVDDATPQLVVAGSLALGASLSQEQFHHFVRISIDGVKRLVEECRSLEYFFPVEEQGSLPPSTALH